MNWGSIGRNIETNKRVNNDGLYEYGQRVCVSGMRVVSREEGKYAKVFRCTGFTIDRRNMRLMRLLQVFSRVSQSRNRRYLLALVDEYNLCLSSSQKINFTRKDVSA